MAGITSLALYKKTINLSLNRINCAYLMNS